MRYTDTLGPSWRDETGIGLNNMIMLNASEGQDVPCICLAHDEMENVLIVIILRVMIIKNVSNS